MEQNEIQKTEQASPNEMIRLAIEGNADLEKLEKLLGLQERYEANEARKVFASDFAVAQASIACVLKTKNNPQTHSKYAGLDSVIETSKPVYTKHGFSIIFYEGKTEVTENIRVCADVLHKAGHKETYHFDVPLDGVGIKGNANMTKIHGKASSVSYGRRYLLCMIWNIPTQDDDGNGAGKKPKPKPGKPTDENNRVLDAVIEALEPAVTKNRVIDKEKLAAVFKNKANRYPDDKDTLKSATTFILNLNQEDTWTIPRKFKDGLVDKNRTSDEVFDGYKKALESTVDDLHFIDREKFNVAAEDCIVEPGDDLIAWAIKNILLEKVVEKRPF